jgi:hypothetical protein
MAKVFPTHRRENFKHKLFRTLFNWFPSYRRGGGRVCFISNDMHEFHISVKLGITTRNYVGSVFGGSLYAAIDPIYMFQLIKILGNDYVVWDKSAMIKFIRPVKTTVYAKFELTNELVNEIKHNVEEYGKYIIELPVELKDKDGIVYFIASKQIYIASKEYYKTRKTSL